MTRTASLGAGVVVCGALAAAFAWQRRDVAQMQAQLARLEAETSGPRSTPGASPVAPPARSADPPSTPEQASLAHREHEARLVERRRRRRAAIESGFEGEVPDPAWSVATETQIDGSVRQLLGAKLVSRACRTTLCRVVLSHESSRAQYETANQLSRLPPFDNEASYDYDRASAPLTTTIYLARAGRSLPRSND